MVANIQGRSPSGQEAWTYVDLADIDYGAASQAANTTTENAQVLAGIESRHIPLVNYELTGGGGTPFFSHARVSSFGNILLALSVSNGVAEQGELFNPKLGRIHNGIHRAPPSNTSSLALGLQGLSFQAQWFFSGFDPANIPANSVSDSLVGVGGGDEQVILGSPRLALPAGVAYSHCVARESDDQVLCVLANLTAGAIDPASLDFDFVSLKRDAFALQAIDNDNAVRTSPSGLITVFTQPVTINAGLIASATVLETQFTVPGPFSIPANPAGAPGTVVLVTPDAALPAGLGISHGRISGDNVGQVGLANLTGGGIDPGPIGLQLTFFIPPQV